ncbi:MAG: hypothetical protein ABJA74_05940 [Lapillicoccus sp.]
MLPLGEAAAHGLILTAIILHVAIAQIIASRPSGSPNQTQMFHRFLRPTGRNPANK